MAIKAPGGDTNVFQKLYNATVTAQQQTFVKGGGAVLGNHLGRAAGGAIGTAVATAITIEAAKLTSEQAQAAVDTFNLMKAGGHSNLAAGWQTVPEAAFTAGFAVGTGLAALAIPAAIHATVNEIKDVNARNAKIAQLLAAEGG